MPEPLKVILCHPCHGEPKAESVDSCWTATSKTARIGGSDREVSIDIQRLYGSLLANVFNTAWCYALNTTHCGGRVDYFAMLHSDIACNPGWLDRLIAELEDKRLDVLGVVSPLKNDSGLTSIAMDNRDGDTWKPRCRLTLKEVFDLPETFTEADLPLPLLINTGCWVAKWDQQWCKKVRFTISDRIVFNRAFNRYMAEVEPEDWYVSRLFNELGLRVGVTRKISLRHAGGRDFENTEPYGKPFDSSYVFESLVSPKWFAFPHDVDGWLLPEEGRALAELARGKRVLEIGSYCGRSTICMAQTASGVVSIDTHDGRGTPSPRNTLLEFRANLVRHGLDRKVHSCGRDEIAVFPAKFDVVFIDGAHDAASVRADIDFALANLRDGGTIVFHDYRDESGQHDGRWDPDVTRTVNEFLADGAKLVARHATLAVVKPPRLVLEST